MSECTVGTNNGIFMVETLSKHIFFDRLLPILPIESSPRTYEEVESMPFFLSLRTLIMNVAISHGLDPIIKQILDLTNLILQDETIISAAISDEARNSILILSRLLSDTMECCWDKLEDIERKNSPKDSGNYSTRQENLFTSFSVGYSIYRPGFHANRPSPLNPDLAYKLISICSKIKFNTNTLKTLQNMSKDIFGNNTSLSLSILPQYQTFLKRKGFPTYTEKVDITVYYIQRYVAAANPLEFSRFKNINVLNPLSSTNHTDLGNVIQHFDLFGCTYITRNSLAKYLNLIRMYSSNLKRTIFGCLLLYYASQTLMFWIMARPKEYTELFHDLKKFTETSGQLPNLPPATSFSPTNCSPNEFTNMTNLQTSNIQTTSNNNNNSTNSNNNNNYNTNTTSSTTHSNSSSNSSSSTTNTLSNPTFTNNNNNAQSSTNSNIFSTSMNLSKSEIRTLSNTHSSPSGSSSIHPSNVSRNSSISSSNSNGNSMISATANNSIGLHVNRINSQLSDKDGPELLKLIAQLVSTLFDDIYSTFNVSTLLTTYYQTQTGNSNATNTLSSQTNTSNQNTSTNNSLSTLNLSTNNIQNNNNNTPNQRNLFSTASNTSLNTVSQQIGSSYIPSQPSPSSSTTVGGLSQAPSTISNDTPTKLQHSSSSSSSSSNISTFQFQSANSSGSNTRNLSSKRSSNPLSPIMNSHTFNASAGFTADLPNILSPHRSNNNNDNAQSFSSSAASSTLQDMPFPTMSTNTFDPKKQSSSASSHNSHHHSYHGIQSSYSKKKDNNETTVKNVLDLYISCDDSESSTHISVLRFLSILLMLDTDIFSDINQTSFKYIPNVDKTNKFVFTDTKDKDKDKEKSTGGIKHFTHGLKRLTSLTPHKKKAEKFLTLLLKYYNGSVQIPQTSLLETMRTLMTIFTLASSVALVDKNINCVIFAQRLLLTLGPNLKVGEKWEGSTIPCITSCLQTNPAVLHRLKIEYFVAALRLRQKDFLYNLQLKETVRNLDFKKLSFYTESFRVFFHPPTTMLCRANVASETSEFFKTLLCTISDLLGKDFPYIDDLNIAEIISAIIDNTITDKFTYNIIIKASSPSSLPSITSVPSSPNNSDIIALSPGTPSMTETAYHGTSKLSQSTSVSSDNSVDIMSPLPQSDLPLGHLISPRARRVSNGNPTSKRINLASSPVDSDKYRTDSVSVSSVLLSATSPISPIQKGIKSPLRQGKQSRTDDNLSKIISQSISDVTEGSTHKISNKYAIDEARAIMGNTFMIFRGMTNYFLLPAENDIDLRIVSEDFKNIIKPFFVAIIDADTDLQLTAQSFMSVLLNHISAFKPENDKQILVGYYLLCTYSVTLFCTALMNLDLHYEKQEIIIDILVKFLQMKSEIAKASEETGFLDGIKEVALKTFKSFYGTLGRGLFVSLYTNRATIQKKLHSAFVEYCKEIEFYEKIIGIPDTDWIGNRRFIESMSQDNYVASGSVAFQRHLRGNILKYIERPNVMLLDAMDLIFKKWLSLTKAKSLSADDAANFRSLAGILASTSGILLNITDDAHPTWNLEEVRNRIIGQVDYFIGKQCQWLNNSDLLTRENSRDILSTELHPLAYRILFDNLRSKIEKLRSVDLSQSNQELHFVLLEQIIIIIRTILKRDNDEKVIFLFSLDIIEFIDQLIEIVEKISRHSSKYYKAIIHLSKVFRAMKHAEDNLALKGHFHLKNKWLKLVIKWFERTISKELDLENLSKPHREMNLKKRDSDFLYVDTSIESCKALSYLTENVPLEIPPSVSEAEMKRSKNVIFGNFFSILLKGLRKTTDLEQFPPSLKHKIHVLYENIISTLTNLSNANVTTGLRYTLPMGNSNNRDIRLAFLKLFTEIVNNYSKHKDILEQEKSDYTKDLLRIVVGSPNFVLKATQICPANDIDEYTASLVNLFEICGHSNILINVLIEDEIDRATRHMEILRRNSCATRALSLYSRSKGRDYLLSTLRPVFECLSEEKDYFEIDKLQADNPQYDAKIQLFKKYMTKLIDSISDSVSDFPDEFFAICQTIYRAVRQKFPEYAYVAVGSFLFLRFFCPSLVSPESEDVFTFSHYRHKRTSISLAKVIQNIANGADNLVKWPALIAEADFLKECNTRIFDFLAEICDPRHEVSLAPEFDSENVSFTKYDFAFFHKFLYIHELDIRTALFDDNRSYVDITKLKKVMLTVDKLLQLLGQPTMEYKNEIPVFVKEKMDKYPQLYEFMSKHAFKNTITLDSKQPFVHESMSSDGSPIITLTFRRFGDEDLDSETVVYRIFQIYARLWTTKHYLVLDCTEFAQSEMDISKTINLFVYLLPEEALLNCQGYYFYNITEHLMDTWVKLLEQDNPFMYYKVPHHFVNNITDHDLVNSLGLSGQTIEISKDIRVSLHDITLYNEQKKKFVRVSLRIGSKYFQILHETPKQYKFQESNELISLRYNDIYKISQISSVNVSLNTGVKSEFTVQCDNDTKLIFSSPKYLEIVKMFYYALAKTEEEYEIDESTVLTALNITDEQEVIENKETLAQIILIIFGGFFIHDDVIKIVSYNLLASIQNAFNLKLGVVLRNTPEVHVPDDPILFSRQISGTLAKTAPELTPYITKHILMNIENNIIPNKHIPHSIMGFSFWIPNLYKYIYLADEEEGPETFSHIVRVLIKLSLNEPHYTSIYMQHIWFKLALDGRLTGAIVEEIVNHALERDSENKDWEPVLRLLTSLPTVDITCHIIRRLMRVIKSFLPSLKLEASTQSWSELSILAKISIPLFFESPLMTQMYLPEVLFIISLLVDVGPHDTRISFHSLLMNVCHSLTINEALSAAHRYNLDQICGVFSRQKLKFIFGFSQDKGRILQNFSASSFASKFNTLEDFTANIMLVMENAYYAESAQWKTRYKKYLMDTIFNSDSFLSARAMMILGIMGKSDMSEVLCKNLLAETMKVIAQPQVSDEQLFLLIAHIFSYSKIVEGLDPSLLLMKRLFWFAESLTGSPHPVLFEGGLLFMTKCIRRLYMYHFEDTEKLELLTPKLINARSFALPLLEELDSFNEIRWTEGNFAHIILSLICRGLSIPFVKANAIDCLEQFFRNSYYERRVQIHTSHYMVYLFMLFVILGNNEFNGLLDSVEYEDEMIQLDGENKIPKTMADWLSSDDQCSRLALYQIAVFFNSFVSDEQSKIRFLLVVRYLLQTNPVCVFRFYTIMRNELRRISSLEYNVNCVTISFEIIGLLVKYVEYTELVKYNQDSIRMLRNRGLISITKIKIFDQNFDNLMVGMQENTDLVYQRKRLTTMIIGRMAYDE
ncbi:hypothetical protein TBLA_0F01100 [Henningerozyma blattae CBS 6284]|uniref:Ras-GAP domain-containing protein n=1 Tax=Henningerozyma blattae (strain ATCC 34711 / CBS 6284 / DSM 70876 / NBRC 10599 / NRRL Y-10934 / UCD 77-7) TaxID=1071380 RepID=I2H5K1_HENB6|nr:hypothetical protein TBLA_0F01100 [Tetrapisispora blattae CBS 6284]CCH61653.1 hypothetical protein TBLA_0F01100 [Tetrapisispora blattae CBS 6284]